MGPDFITSIEAKTGIETPQIVLSWTFDNDLETPITEGVLHKWSLMRIQRSDDRYPESTSEGSTVLSEGYSSLPTTGYGDVVSLEPFTSYYYSLFFDYVEHSASELSGIDQDISRLGTTYGGVVHDIKTSIVSATDGSSTSNTVFTSASSTFLTDEVEAGFILHIDEGGADDGYYRIVSVDSETQITIDTSLTLTASSIDFSILSDQERYWISGIDYTRKPTLWRWNSESEMVDFKVSLSDVLDFEEYPKSIVFVGELPSDPGNNWIAFTTNKRYIKIPYENATPDTDDIANQWLFSSTSLTPGFIVAGVTIDLTNEEVYILNKTAAEIVAVEEATPATTVITIDLSAIQDVVASSDGQLRGIHYSEELTDKLHVGNKNYVYSFDASLTAPDNQDLDSLTYTRDLLRSDFTLRTDLLTDTDSLVIVDDNLDKVREYTIDEVARGYLWQQQAVDDPNTVALYRMEADATDSSNNTYDGTVVGMVTETGYFGGGLESTLDTHHATIDAIDGSWDGDEGSVSIWVKATDAESLSDGDHIMFSAEVDASNRVFIEIASGNLRFRYSAGGTDSDIEAVHPSPDTEWHNYIITWSATDDEVKAYVDGVQFGSTQTGLGTWVGSLASATIGYTSTSLVGVYDELHISDVARVVRSPDTLTTSANRMHANSGRNYNESYADDDLLGFFYRDELFTPKFMGGEYLIRNDYEKDTLFPPNNTMDDGEIIFRDTELPKLGDLGRLARLIGLFFDRISDDRYKLKDRLDLNKVDVDFMESIADSLGLLGMDTENWNVDLKRRFLKIMPIVHARGGRFDSYCILAKLLGFYVTKNTLVARRRWDTVVASATDPVVQPIYLDQMDSMDTGDESFPLALLRFIFYKESTESTSGTTSVAASRLLTDLSASFRDTVQVGSLIVIGQGQDDSGVESTDAEYEVTEIHSDTVLKVNKDWYVGGNSNVTYRSYWRIPEVDPYTNYMLTRYADIAPSSMRVERLSDDATL